METFYCENCNRVWRDIPNFWGKSDCPECNEAHVTFELYLERKAAEEHDPETDHLYEAFPTSDEHTEDTPEESDLDASPGDELGEEDTDIASGAESTGDSAGDSDGDGDGDSDGGGDGGDGG